MRKSTRFTPSRQQPAQAARPAVPPSALPSGTPSATEARLVAMRGGFEALHAGRFEEARVTLLPFIRPDDPEATLLGGLAMAACGDASGAAPLLNAVAARRPEALHPCLDLMSLLRPLYRLADAEPVFLACLALTPEEPKLRLGYGHLLTDLQRPEEAMVEVEACLAALPDYWPAVNQKGIVLAAMTRSAEAIALFEQVVAAEPANAAAWANIGCALTAEGVFEEALSAYRRSIQIKPRDAQVRLNHSISLLKAGRMVQGWQEHEWRFRLPGHTTLPMEKLLPTLGPDTDLSGRSVLVTHEEGLGDTLLFLRFVPLLAALGARVVAWVPAALADTVARVVGVAEVRTDDTAVLDCDFHCPFISLPRAFALRAADAWGAPVPYLNVDPERVARAALHVPPARPGGPLRVGLVWGGAPRPENVAANAIDRRRSIDLHRLAPLAALDSVALVSLQIGPYAEQLADPPEDLRIFDPTDLVGNTDDTANLIAALDLVVSVDTSVAHLAGGLGQRVILLDRYDNCWRWFHGRTDSPWYPGLEIIRQTAPGDWDGVVKRLCARLRQIAGNAPDDQPDAATVAAR